MPPDNFTINHDEDTSVYILLSFSALEEFAAGVTIKNESAVMLHHGKIGSDLGCHVRASAGVLISEC
jgi:hypothetical protein